MKEVISWDFYLTFLGVRHQREIAELMIVTFHNETMSMRRKSLERFMMHSSLVTLKKLKSSGKHSRKILDTKDENVKIV